MEGEDFTAFSAIVPSTYLFIGSRNEELGFDFPHHHPKIWTRREQFFDWDYTICQCGDELFKIS